MALPWLLTPSAPREHCPYSSTSLPYPIGSTFVRVRVCQSSLCLRGGFLGILPPPLWLHPAPPSLQLCLRLSCLSLLFHPSLQDLKCHFISTWVSVSPWAQSRLLVALEQPANLQPWVLLPSTSPRIYVLVILLGFLPGCSRLPGLFCLLRPGLACAVLVSSSTSSA